MDAKEFEKIKSMKPLLIKDIHQKTIINDRSLLFRPMLSKLSENVRKNGCAHNFHNLELVFKRIEEDRNIDKVETINFLMAHGGFCDCEILLNVSCMALSHLSRQFTTHSDSCYYFSDTTWVQFLHKFRSGYWSREKGFNDAENKLPPAPPARFGYYHDEYMRSYDTEKEGLPF